MLKYTQAEKWGVKPGNAFDRKRRKFPRNALNTRKQVMKGSTDFTDFTDSQQKGAKETKGCDFLRGLTGLPGFYGLSWTKRGKGSGMPVATGRGPTKVA